MTKRGDKPLYSPQQTEHYKSMWLRYQKSLFINPDSVREVDGKQVYSFLSERSPNGKWEVSKGEDSNLGFGFKLVGDLFANQGIADDYDYLPPEAQIFEDPNTIFNGTITLKSGANPIARPLQIGLSTAIWLADESLYPSLTSIKYRLTWSLAIAPLGGAIAREDPLYSVAASGSGGSITDTPSGFVDATREGTLGTTLDNAASIILIKVSQSIRSFAPGDGVSCTASQNFQILEVNQTPVENVDYKCTCPDFRKKIGAFSKKFYTDDKVYKSELQARDWSSSDAGTPEYCKHILAVMRYRGEPIPEYLDVPEVE